MSDISAQHPDAVAGWRFVYENVAPTFSNVRERVARARLSVSPTHPLSEKKYLAFAWHQAEVLREIIDRFPRSFAALSREANRYESSLRDTSAITTACDEASFHINALAAWAEALWQTVPPGSLHTMHVQLREVPQAIIDQMEPYFATIAAASQGTITAGTYEHTIDLEPLVENLTKAIAADDKRPFNGRSLLSSCQTSETGGDEYDRRVAQWRERRHALGRLILGLAICSVVTVPVGLVAPPVLLLTGLLVCAMGITALAWIFAWSMP